MPENKTPKFESNLIPIMRDGVELIKMVLFKKLKASLADRYQDRNQQFRSMLIGAIVNELFGVANNQEPFAKFYAENRNIVNEELEDLNVNFAEMRIPLTDALRMQYLCDQMDHLDDDHILVQAQKIGLLIEDRDLPMPNSFMDIVRRMGKSLGLIVPPLPDEDTPTESTI